METYACPVCQCQRPHNDRECAECGSFPITCQDCGRIVHDEWFWYTDDQCPSEIYCQGCGPKHGFPRRRRTEGLDNE